jgi:peroxiredoxin
MAVDTDTQLRTVEHLTGRDLPPLILPATNGQNVLCTDLAGWSVFYFYPRTSPPNAMPIEGWNEIPGARGCTPQSCGFRDHFEDLKSAGATAVFGVSAQDTDYQREAVDRLRLPFPLISDTGMLFHRTLGLPVFTAAGLTLYGRVTLVTFGNSIKQVFDPVSDPAGNAQTVLAYLKTQQQE